MDDTNHDLNEPELEARRRLLKLGMYIPPVILGIAIMSVPSTASAVVGSCCPSACQPCIDLSLGHEQDGEILKGKDLRKAKRKCLKAKKKRKC